MRRMYELPVPAILYSKSKNCCFCLVDMKLILEHHLLNSPRALPHISVCSVNKAEHIHDHPILSYCWSSSSVHYCNRVR